ncbi:MAG: exo-alpha-sialidase [Candidatus Hydrogenedentes bacterium]|nr:exo-alpha-sialidase [Candidatus Hydrogenedentota bacterium]
MTLSRLVTLLCGLLFGGTLMANAIELGGAVGPVSMTTLSGHPRVMKNYAEHKATVVVFMSTRCDATLAQLAALRELHRADDKEEMVIVGVFSNPDESGEEISTYCQRRGVVFPVHRDPSRAAAKQFGAKVTPEYYLINHEGKLVYHGDIEGLKPAALALLAGKAITTAAETPVQGTPIDRPGPKRDVEALFSSIAFSSELVFTEIPGATTHHCSTIAEAPNGDLLCLWYGGSFESADDQALFLSRLKKGERFWSTPKPLIQNPDMPPGNAIIFRDPKDRLWIIWGRMEGSRPTRRGTGWDQCRLMIRNSSDGGVTWSEDREWKDTFGWLPRNPPITLKDGAFVLPMSIDTKTESGSVLARLGADGTTWSRVGGLFAKGEQMTLVQRNDGSLLAYGRNMPFIVSSESRDAGVTWSKTVPTTLKCPSSAICMIRLKSGRLLVAHNDNDNEDRATLAIHQSEDEGKTWKDEKIIELEPNKEQGEYSYPCLLQTSDGMIHITYTFRRFAIKHVTFNEGWLTQLERPN